MKPLLHRLGLHIPRDYDRCVDCLLWRQRFFRETLTRHVFERREALPIGDWWLLKEERRKLREYSDRRDGISR